MYSLEQMDRSPSRRAVLRSGLAGVFVLGFHLPARAVNEPEQLPDSTQGQVCAQRVYPHRSLRADHAGDAAGRDGAGRIHGDCDDSCR